VPIVGGLNLRDPQGWFSEETLDVEAVHAMAPGAMIVVQAALSPENIDLHMAQNRVVSGNEAQIVSASYGGASDSTDNTSNGYWEQAAAQGIGVYFSSGDDGDQTAGGGTDPASRSVDAGPNSPYVTVVGGTTLAVGRSNNYQFETYWGTDTATLSKRDVGHLELPVRRRRRHQPGVRRARLSVNGRPRPLRRLLAGQRQRAERIHDPRTGGA
jgi:subtilase family serine protease